MNARVPLVAAALLIACGAVAAVAQDDAPGEPAAAKEPPTVACTHEVVATGEGAACSAGKAAVVHYTGTLLDGKKFDSSRDRGQPFAFEIGAGMVIKGWDETVATMRVGDRWKVTIPWQLAYGERGAPPNIPGKADLMFDIEVLDLVEPLTEVVQKGEGRALEMGDILETHYTLSVVDGETISDTRKAGTPAALSVGRSSGVMGLDMMLKRMHVGDRWKITIPPVLAFGAKGAPPKIPADATVVFDVEVLGVIEPKIETLVEGSGARPERGQRVSVHYTGTLTDGKKFDSSRDRDAPFAFVLGSGQVISGWDITVAQMRVGQRVKVTIPWQLAYGPNGRPPMIPPRADLVFDIELLGIE